MLLAQIGKFIYDSVLCQVLIILAIIIFCVVAYKNSVKSRKYYVCPSCGESFRTEYMDSKCCKVCGAKLIEQDDTSINDKA